MTAGARAPFHAVVRKIWPYGLGLAFGTVGFGVIATFITLYFAAHEGAAFTLSLFSVGFICVRAVLGNTITRFGGVPVSACFIIESLGLLLIWLAPSAWMAGVGAFLTGSGFSLVFPAPEFHAVVEKSGLTAWGWPLAPSVSALSPPLSPSTSPRTAGRAPRLPCCSASALSAFARCWKYHYPLWRSPGLLGLLHHRKSRPAAYLAGAIEHGWPASAPSHRFGFLAGLSGFRS